MSGDPLGKVTSGQRWIPTAAAINAWNDLVAKERTRTGSQPVSIPAPNQTLARVKNSTGADLDRWSVVALRDPAFTPTDAPDSFAENLSFSTATPDEGEDFGRFGILQGPLADGAIGRAVVSGITYARIRFTSANTGYPAADVADGITEYLQPCMRGAASILWREEGTGTKWAIVKISKTDPLPFVIEDCQNRRLPRYALHPEFDRLENLGSVIKIEGSDGCWMIRRAACDEVNALGAQPVVIANAYEDCEECLACWKLTNCNNSEDIFYSNSDLAAYKNQYVYLAANEQCYLVEQHVNCLDVIPVEVTTYYTECEECGKCYLLKGCDDPEDTLKVLDPLWTLIDPEGEEPEDAISAVFRINGTCYQVNSYGSDCTGAEFLGLTEDAWYAACEDCGCVKLTEVCVGAPGPVIYAKRATDELTGDPIDLHDLAGDGVIRLASGKLYTVEDASPCVSAEEVIVQEHYGNDSPDLCPRCFRLTPCGGGADIKTYEDLKGQGYDVGDVVLLVDADEVRYCYTIAEEIDWDEGCVSLGDEAHPVGGKWLDEQKYESCDNCNLLTKYKLTNDCIHPDCEGNDPAEDIVTTTDLHAHIGKFVKYRGVCYKVSETEDEVTVADLGDFLALPTCAECQEAEQTWSETIVTDVRAHAATFKLQMKQTTIQVTGKSNCDEDGGGWIDIDTGEECEE